MHIFIYLLRRWVLPTPASPTRTTRGSKWVLEGAKWQSMGTFVEMVVIFLGRGIMQHIFVREIMKKIGKSGVLI